MIETYTPEQVKRLYVFSNTVVAAQMFGDILERSRADVLSTYWGEGDQQSMILLDRKYIRDLNKIGFEQYWRLRQQGLQKEAVELLEINGPKQTVNTETLMEFDREYSLL